MLLIVQILFLVSHIVCSSSLGSQAGSTIQLCHSDEHEALITFKTGFTMITSLSNRASSQSPYAKTNSWDNNIDCCQWDGVTCDLITGHVTKLDLSSSLLNGSFPANSTLFLLQRLKHLDLSYNKFSSPIPLGFGRLSSLTYLNLSNSGFLGQVPMDLGWLSRLAILDLSGNFYAAVPKLKTIIANLTNLRDLDLSGVNITSDLPPMMANLSKLEYLQLFECSLQGDLMVTSFLDMPNLRVLDLGSNYNMHCHFSTSTNLRLRSSLKVLDLSWCNFNTHLPNSIGESSNSSLLSLNVIGCGFCGDVPNWVWTVSTKISLSRNSLSGLLPSTMNTTILSRVSFIDISYNNITGFIPTWLFTLPLLKYLNLDQNLFIELGHSTIANISSSSTLEEFSARSNQLQGKIPETIFRLHNLKSLQLEWNNLTGTIPFSKMHNLQNLISFGLSHNHLSIVDDMGVDSTSSWPTFSEIGLSSCNLGHFPRFLRKQKNLVVLELSDNRIRGMVPKWFQSTSTTSLNVLDLSRNSLTGGLEILPWYNLFQIDISFNMFEGVFPMPPFTIGFLYASNNQFTGDIPFSLCDLGLPHIVDLSHNNFTGKIPMCFANLLTQGVSILDLRQNQLQGVIPSYIFEVCSSLSTLSLSNNLFEGPTPQSLRNCISLQFLDLGNNNLNGTFPHWLAILPNLKVLILGSNNIHGPLIGSNETILFRKLQILDISNNALTGELPSSLLLSFKAMLEMKTIDPLEEPYMMLMLYIDSIKAWVKGSYRDLHPILDALVLIDASKNRLDGRITDVIGDLINIRWLNLSHNNFTGNIPSSLGNLRLLESLDLSFNKLDGHIPRDLVNLNYLEFFNVSENNLVGPVPTGEQFDTFLDPSYLGNLGLCGELLTKKCITNDQPPISPPIEDKCLRSSNLHVWEIVVMGYGCGLFVGLVWGYFLIWERNHFWVVRLTFNVELFIFMLISLRARRRG